MGDWGTQFGLMAVGLELFADDELKRRLLDITEGEDEAAVFISSSVGTNPLEKLLEIYVKVNEAADQEAEIRLGKEKLGSVSN